MFCYWPADLLYHTRYMRAGMYAEAQLMLSERFLFINTYAVDYSVLKLLSLGTLRVTLCENDGQSWFQLSAAASHLDDGVLGEMAYIKAWNHGMIYFSVSFCIMLIILCAC